MESVDLVDSVVISGFLQDPQVGLQLGISRQQVLRNMLSHGVPAPAHDDIADLSDQGGADSSSEEKRSQEEYYRLLTTPNMTFHLFVPYEVVQEGTLYRIGPFTYDDERQVFRIRKNEIKVPSHRDVGVNEFELILNGKESDNLADRFIIDYADDPVRLGSNEYVLSLDRETHVFVDERGCLAFNLGEDLAVLDMQNHHIRYGQLMMDLVDVDRQIAVKGAWLFLPGQGRINGRAGLIHLGGSTIKLTRNSRVTVLEDRLDIRLKDSSSLKERTLSVELQDHQMVLSGEELTVRLQRGSKVFIDKHGGLAFEQGQHLGRLHLEQATLTIGKIELSLEKGSHLRLNRKSITMNGILRLFTGSRKIRYNGCTWLLPKCVTMMLKKNSLLLKVKNKSLCLFPRHKQLYIRVGGKLIILTVTIGVAMDQNGNLAFDYRGNLSLLDTSSMVLTVDGVKLGVNQAKGTCVELIGSHAIVSSGSEHASFLNLFANLLKLKGVDDLLQTGSEGSLNLESLIEQLMNVSDPREILNILINNGISLEESNVAPVLAQMFSPQKMMELLQLAGQGMPGSSMSLPEGAPPTLMLGKVSLSRKSSRSA